MTLADLTPQLLGYPYNWVASLTSIAATIALVALGRFLMFKVPPFARTHDFNRGENRKKIKTEKFQTRLRTSNMVALATNLFFFVVIAPFITTFDPQPWWRVGVDTFTILMVYDFFYYLMHRFVFHGKGYFRMVHAVHHQARKPTLTSLDSLLLHPWEAFLGIVLYMVVTTSYCLIAGVQMHVVTVILTTIIYTQINQLNHTRFPEQKFPQHLLHWIGDKHSLHHIDMHHGNYATITLLFDKLFGTFE
jgi:sterol desaturase/sphingolipid hydroxylase (fatty acid hydroxylase superfamily)